MWVTQELQGKFVNLIHKTSWESNKLLQSEYHCFPFQVNLIYTEKGPTITYFQKPGIILITENKKVGGKDYLCAAFYFLVLYKNKIKKKII